jgi:hypothetical protein
MSHKWKPLQRAGVDPRDYTHPKYAYLTEMQMQADGSTFEEAAAKLKAYDDACLYFRNDLYQVQVRKFFNHGFEVEMVHLNIRRVDGAPIFDWRHRQRIKNELVGEECEAFELYPAESRLSDTSNKYHLWAFVDPFVRLPVRINSNDQRDVVEHEVKGPPGQRQRRIAR